MEAIDNCNPNVGLDWEEVDMLNVIEAAESGIEGAKKELERRQRLFEEDTIRAKALDQSAITIEWIED
jgi:multidrug resistance efflux pump